MIDCNKNGCPGMAHPCNRISYQAARSRYAAGERSAKVCAAMSLQCLMLEHQVTELQAELLEAYRANARNR